MSEVTVPDLHPEFLKKNGKPEFVVLPYEEFVAMQELLEDATDLLDLRKAKREEAAAPTISLDELRSKFGLTT